MGRLPSWLIIAALGVLVALAAADAIRPHGETRAPASTGTESHPDVHGLLVFADDDCSARAVRLPRLVQEKPFAPDCDGRRWSRDGSLMAVCRAGVTEVFAGLAHVRTVRGCAPAWREDGVLSVIQDGDLVTVRRRGRPRVYLSREALADALAGEIESGSTYRLTEVAWNGSVSFTGIVAGPQPWQQAVILYTPEGLAEVIPELGQHISSIRVSPLGNIAFARSQVGREFVMLSALGDEVPLPRIANARAIAWSPDERWVALATRTISVIARTGTRRVVMRLPLGGDSLDWRS